MRSFCLCLSLLAVSAPAQDGGGAKLKGSVKQSAPKIDLGLPTFGSIPRGEALRKAEEPQPPAGPAVTSGLPAYEVVSVQHGKSFIRTPAGSKPGAPFAAVSVSGSPPVTERFSTVIRVKAPERKGTSIEVAVLDPRGDTVMEASGTLSFKSDETDWTVDWEPTSVRAAGDFQVLVRVGGNPLGTFPLRLETKKP